MSQPCSSRTGQICLAPAAIAWACTAFGSSTTSTKRVVAPPSVSGLKFLCSGDSSATQNFAVSTASCATTAPSGASILNSSRAPNAAL